MYADIAKNKRRTWVLIIIMSTVIVGIFAIIGSINGVDAGASIVLGTMLASVYVLFSYYASSSVALAVAGAKAIEKSQAPDIYNVVENLCIANGQPMPKIYIIEDESPNAFATGRDPKNASIALTTGILRILDRKELEGVIAHELAHIKNYDIRVMTIVVVLVGLITLIADILIHTRLYGNSKENNNAGIALFLFGVVLAILSPLFGKIIQLAVSRSREFLADASGALLTRYPEGLASALEKIDASATPLKQANHATAHLYISNPFKGEGVRSFSAKLFSTHPPIAERVARLRSMGR